MPALLRKQEAGQVATEADLCSHGGRRASRNRDKLQQMIAAGASRLTSTLDGGDVSREVAAMIDHTLLKPDATPDQIALLCHEARRHSFAAVCVNPIHVRLCAQLLEGTAVQVCTVVGFPLGATSPEVKAFETQQALDDGATEVDMVINIGALKARDYALVQRDIAGVARTAHARAALLKVIIEAALLSDDEKVAACQLAESAGADYVKTSTGFGPDGASVHDVELMRRAVGAEMGVKAAGGIRSYEDARAMITAGATRIGASAGVRIVKEASCK